MALKPTDSEFRYADVLLMPLRGTILLTMLSLALLTTLAINLLSIFQSSRVAVFSLILGIWLLLASAIACIRYAQIIVDKIAHGHHEPPPLSAHDFRFFLNYGAMGFYAALIVLILPSGLINAYLGSALATIYIALIVFAIPALLATSVLENNIVSAFNPVRIAKIIRAIGRPYVGLCVVVTGGYLASKLQTNSLGWLFIEIAAGYYALFLLSCAVGRLINVSRFELGLNIVTPAEHRAQQDAQIELTQDSEALQLAQQTARVAPQEAAAALWRYHITNRTQIERQVASFYALQKWPSTDTALRFAQPLALALVTRSRDHEALDIVAWCFTQTPNFRLAEPETSYRLGLFAQQNGQPKLAAQIMQDMGTRFPEYPNTIEALLRVGTIAANRLNHVPLLNSVLTQLAELGVSTDHPSVVTLKQQLTQLKKTN